MGADTITVQMNRTDSSIPWGFRLQGGKEFGAPLTVGRISQGGVAEKAGLKEGDYLVQVAGRASETLRHKEAQDLILGCGNSLEIVIERGLGGVRIWAPSVKSVAVAPGDTTTAPVKISLAHDNRDVQQPIDGHNVPAKPFTSPNITITQSNPTMTSNLQYNSPAALYSKSNAAAEAYLQQTGGLFGTENVFCKAGEKNLHPDCFNCATCGSNLKNKGYHLVRDKLYCDIHARQQTENLFKATPPVDPSVFAGRAAPPTRPVKNPEPVKAFYQPEILKRGGIFHPPRPQKMSPQSRGVPTHPGESFKFSGLQFTSNDYSLSGSSPVPPVNLPPSTAPFSTYQPPSSQPAHHLNAVPLASTSAGKFQWPPKSAETQPSSIVNTSWKIPEDLTSGYPHSSIGHDYERLIKYHLSQFARNKETPLPLRHKLTEDVPRQYEWKQERREMELQKIDQIDKLLDTKLELLGDFTENFDHIVVIPRITTSISFEQTGPKLAGKNLVSNGKDVHSAEDSTVQTTTTNTVVVSTSDTLKDAKLDSSTSTNSKPVLKTILKKGSKNVIAEQFSTTSSAVVQETKVQDDNAREPESLIHLCKSSLPETINQFDESAYPPWRNSASRSSGGVSPNVPSGGQLAGSSAPKRGRGILKQLSEGPRIPICENCRHEIRGPFVLALGKTWCPDHFVCTINSCNRKLIDIGFVEEQDRICCEYCFEKFFAPTCTKCNRPVTGDCLTAMQHQWHPDCFTCVQCHKPFGNSSFFVENGQPICENDWNSSYTTKCVNCHFAIEGGDRWVEALGNPYHSDCFTCTICQKNLEGQSFYAKGNKPYCKAHA